MDAESNAESIAATPNGPQLGHRGGSTAKAKALIGLLVVGGVAMLCWMLVNSLTVDRKKWVHPEVKGRALDATTGQPISGAVIKLIDSEYGGGETTSNARGEFRLDAVSQRYLFGIPLHGDTRFTSKIECSALHYQSQVIEVRHGPNGVWDAPLVIPIDFSMTES